MKSTITFNRFNVGVHIEKGKPYLSANDMGKAWGYKSSLSVKPEDKPLVVGGRNYIPVERLHLIVERTTGSRRSLAQAFLADVEREFIGAMPVQQSPILPATLESSYEVKVKKLQLEKELLNDKIELLRLDGQIIQAEATKRDIQLRILDREAELQSIRPQNLVELKAVNGG
jgi:hypothetical protein